MKPSTSAAAVKAIDERIAEEINQGNIGSEEALSLFCDIKLILEAQQTDTLSELRTQIEEIYTPDADFKDQVLELLGAKKGCVWEPLEGVGKLWCVTHDTDHGLDSAKAEGKE